MIEQRDRLDEIVQFDDVMFQVLTYEGYEGILQKADWFVDREPCGRTALLADLDDAFPDLSPAFLAQLLDNLIGEDEIYYRFREELSGQLTRIH